MLRNVIFIGLIALILIFVVQNTQVVEFRFLLWTISVSRALMLFGTLAVGVLAGWILKPPKGKQGMRSKHKKAVG